MSPTTKNLDPTTKNEPDFFFRNTECGQIANRDNDRVQISWTKSKSICANTHANEAEERKLAWDP